MAAMDIDQIPGNQILNRINFICNLKSYLLYDFNTPLVFFINSINFDYLYNDVVCFINICV